MGKFSSYVQLLEAKREQGVEPKFAAFAFMRCNPPTQGHAQVIKKVEQIAKERNGDPFVFLSHSEDPTDNPLSYHDKLEFMQKMFPDVRFDQGDQPIKNPFQAVGYLSSLQYTDLVLVAGSDQANVYKTRFTNPLKYFDSFQVVSAGERDPDSEGIAGMSARRARLAVAQNNLTGFIHATGWDDEAAELLFNTVRKGMK